MFKDFIVKIEEGNMAENNSSAAGKCGKKCSLVLKDILTLPLHQLVLRSSILTTRAVVRSGRNCHFIRFFFKMLTIKSHILIKLFLVQIFPEYNTCKSFIFSLIFCFLIMTSVGSDVDKHRKRGDKQ